MKQNQNTARRLGLPEKLPAKKDFVPGIRRAPDRGFSLSAAQTRVALKNALRYIPAPLHAGDRPGVHGRVAHPRADLRVSLSARGQP